MFDTIKHELLIKRLQRYRIRGIVLDWVKSYLSKRQQFVKPGGSSLFLDITCSVPQGSVLGPQFFVLYIKDMCEISKLLHFVLQYLRMTQIFFARRITLINCRMTILK